jgi:hypothetical protein
VGDGLNFAGFLLFCGWPNRIELFDELIGIRLRFALCRKGIEGFVSNRLIVVNIPAVAIGIADVFLRRRW